MIKALGRGAAGRTVVILGLSRENQVRMNADMPVRVRLRDLDPKLPNIEVAIIGGETEADLEDQLRRAGAIRSDTTVHRSGP